MKQNKVINNIINFRNKVSSCLSLLFQCARGETIAIIILSIGMGIYQSIGIVIWKYLVDAIAGAIKTHKLRGVIYVFIGYFLYNVAQFVLLQIRNYLTWRYTERVAIHLNQLVLEKSMKIPYARFEDASLHNILSKANEESTTSISSLLNKMMSLVEYGMTLLSIVLILTPLSIWIVIIALLATIPMAVVDLRMSEQLYDLDMKLTEKKRYAGKFKSILSRYSNLIEIRVYQVASYMKERAMCLQNENYKKENRVRLKQMRISIVVSVLYTILQFVVKASVVCMAIVRKFTVGTITMYINAMDSLSSTLQMIVYTVAALNEDILYVNVLLDYFDLEEEPKRKYKLKEDIHTICFENVTFQYPGAKACVFKELSFTLHEHKKYILYGLNGAGKSTLIKLLLGLYEPSEGEIKVNNIPLKELDRDTYYKKLRVIFQEYNKYPLTLGENIAFSYSGDHKRVEAAAQFSGVDQFVSSLKKGYETLLDKELDEGTQLSLGQWQKTALARMQYEPAACYILDEPTASLDLVAVNRLYRFLFDTSDATVLLISHEYEIAKKADYILVLGEHRLLEQGTYSELINKKGYFFRYVKQRETTV